MKKLIKDIFIKQILEYLANEEYRSLIIRDKNKRNLAETSFVHLIRWYPQINEEGRDSYGLSLFDKILHCEISKNALKTISNDLTNGIDIKTIQKKIHYEHNAPVNTIKNKLLALENPNFEDVKKILEFEYKIVLITKQEANIINKQFKSTGSFTERLKIAKIEIVEKSKCLELIKKYKK